MPIKSMPLRICAGASLFVTTIYVHNSTLLSTSCSAPISYSSIYNVPPVKKLVTIRLATHLLDGFSKLLAAPVSGRGTCQTCSEATPHHVHILARRVGPTIQIASEYVLNYLFYLWSTLHTLVDTLLSMLTVKEMLMYTADLKRATTESR